MKKQNCQKILEEQLANRILVLDGAMGTMIQQHKLEEADFRGQRFAGHDADLKGNNDILCLTNPAIIESIHRGFLDAGADILQTNTFNANRISQADYNLESIVVELNREAAKLAVKAAREKSQEDPSRPRFVAGSIGPTNRTASLSPDVNDPGFRAITFDELVEAYYEQVTGLMEGGVDLLMPETTFDTLNLKAAIFAIERFFEDHGTRVPLMLSVTITDRSGRTLSGQTLKAFWYAIEHARPLSVGINCALALRKCVPTLKNSPPWQLVMSASIPTPACRTPLANMTTPLNSWPKNWANGPKTAGSTSSAAVAVPPPNTSRPFQKQPKPARPGKKGVRPLFRGTVGWNR